MTVDLTKIKMPQGGVLDGSGALSKAGHHYLAAIEDVAKVVKAALNGQGTFGALATLDTVDRTLLVSGFGRIEIATAELAALTTLGTYTTAVPVDDTIPQSTEGDEALSGSYTAISGTSQLRVFFQGVVGVDGGANRAAAVSLYQDDGTDSIGSAYIDLAAGYFAPVAFETWVASPGAGVSTTFSIRIGPNAGAAYLNGSNGTRWLGGAIRSSLRLSEFEAH